MSRRSTIVSTMIIFAFISAASGCSSATNSTAVPRNVAAGMSVAPQSLGSWITKAPMLTGRQDLAAGVIDGTLYAVGGCGPYCNGQPFNTVEAYDAATDTWSTKAAIPTARAGLAIAVVNGILYAIGGYGGFTEHDVGYSNCCEVATVEAYDPSTDSWTTKAPMPTARAFVGVGVINGIVYAAGGRSSIGYVNTLEAYDPSTNTWTRKRVMPTPRWGLAASVINGKMYAMGGYNDHGAMSTVEVYNPVRDR
jgi:N-acetylneuraminic acid mutarotase